jgi:hypothetical protein
MLCLRSRSGAKPVVERYSFMVFLMGIFKIYIMPIDYKKYSHDWKLRSKFIRFFRANNRCEVCGAKNYEPHPVTGSIVILTVAHLDHNIKNNSFFNLKAMCQKCHLTYDAKHHARNRKLNKIGKNQLVINF